MIGTLDEVLLYLLSDFDNAEAFGYSRRKLLVLRRRFEAGTMEEEEKRRLLRNFSSYKPHTLRLIREDAIIPALIKDSQGRIFTEITFCKALKRRKVVGGVDMVILCGNITRGMYPKRKTLAKLVENSYASIVEERVHLPSIWEVYENKV